MPGVPGYMKNQAQILSLPNGPRGVFTGAFFE